jgi:hypothetical protein
MASVLSRESSGMEIERTERRREGTGRGMTSFPFMKYKEGSKCKIYIHNGQQKSRQNPVSSTVARPRRQKGAREGPWT